MSLYVVEREEYNDREFLDRMRYGYSLRPMMLSVQVILDCNDRDGEWHAVVTMAHDVVEYEGYAVPVFEGDLERIEWERTRSKLT